MSSQRLPTMYCGEKKAWGPLWFFSPQTFVISIHDVVVKNVNFPPNILKQRECVQLFVWCSVRYCLHLKDSQCKTHGGRSASAGATEGAVLLLLLFLLLLLLLLLLLCTFSPAGYTYHALCQHATICPDHSHHPYPNPNHDIAHE